MLLADPGAIHAEREGLKAWLGEELEEMFLDLHERAQARCPITVRCRYARRAQAQDAGAGLSGRRKPAAGRGAGDRSISQGDNMTDRQGALMVLTWLRCPSARKRWPDFYTRYQDNPLVVDKWFSLQAGLASSRRARSCQGAGLASGFHSEQSQPGAFALYGFCREPEGFPRGERRGVSHHRRSDPQSRSDQSADRGAICPIARPVAPDRADACRNDARRTGTRPRHRPKLSARCRRTGHEKPWVNRRRDTSRGTAAIDADVNAVDVNRAPLCWGDLPPRLSRAARAVFRPGAWLV